MAEDGYVAVYEIRTNDDGDGSEEASSAHCVQSNVPGALEAALRPLAIAKLRGAQLLPWKAAFFKETLEGCSPNQQLGILLLNVGSPPDKPQAKMVVALVHEEAEILEAFHPELEAFLCGFSDVLHSAASQGLGESDAARLTAWRSEAVDYIAKAVECLGEALPAFLFALYSQRRPNLTSETPPSAAIVAFAQLCGPSESTGQPSLESELDAALSAPGTTFDVSVDADGKASLDCTVSSSFTEEWSQVVGKLVSAGPVPLKQINRAFKDKATGDMHRLRRLLEAAEVDHYALFRTVEFLRETQNAAILLGWARRASAESELLDTIQAYVS